MGCGQGEILPSHRSQGAMKKHQSEHYRQVRSARRRMLYSYARDVLGLSVSAAKDCQTASWMVAQFADHQFPQAIRALAGRGSHRRRA